MQGGSKDDSYSEAMRISRSDQISYLDANRDMVRGLLHRSR